MALTESAPAPGAARAGDAEASRWRRIRPPVLVAGGILAASVALHLRDPHESGSWGFCPWLVLTGTYCPGCGGLRAVNDLTHGDLRSAFSSNALFITSLPLVALLWVRSFRQRWRGVRRPLPASTVTVLATVSIGVIMVFWVVRNLPFAAWMTP